MAFFISMLLPKSLYLWHGMARLFILLFFYPTALWAATFNLFEENGKVGLKNEQGEIVIPATFEALGWANGSFSVEANVTGFKKNGLWGLIHLDKSIVAQAAYESLVYGGGNSVVARKKLSAVTTKTGAISLSGQVLIPFQYDQIQMYGLRAVVIEKRGASYYFGLTDVNHKVLLPTQYKNIYPLGSLRFAVENDLKKIALFSESGKAITDFAIDSLSGFNAGLAKVFSNGLVGIINREGEILVQPKYQNVKIEANGDLTGLQPSTWQVLNEKNAVLNTVHADVLEPFNDGYYKLTYNSKCGLVNKALAVIWPLEFDAIEKPVNAILAFKKARKWGLARIDKATLLNPEYDSLYWDGRLAWIRLADKWAVVNPALNTKPRGQYQSIDKIQGGYRVEKNGFFGMVDAQGKEIVHCVYDSILKSNSNQCAVKFKGLYGLITHNEFWMVPPQPDRIWPGVGEVYIEYSAKKYWLKKTDGTLVYFSDNRIEAQHDHFVEIYPNGNKQLLSTEGVIISASHIQENIPADQPQHRIASSLLAFESGGKFGFKNTKGQMAIPNRYDSVRQFSAGLAPFKLVGKWGYLNEEDKIIIHPAFQFAGDFNNGLAIVRTSKYGIINAKGQWVLEPRFDAIKPLKFHFELVANNASGLMTTDGKVLFLPQYDTVEVLPNGMIKVQSQGHLGVLSPEGLNVIPLHFSAIEYDAHQNRFLAHQPALWQPIIQGK